MRWLPLFLSLTLYLLNGTAQANPEQEEARQKAKQAIHDIMDNLNHDIKSNRERVYQLWKRGNKLFSQHRFTNAAYVFERAAKLEKQGPVPRNDIFTKILIRTGQSYDFAGDYRKAKSVLQQALTVSKTAQDLGPEHENTAMALQALAKVHMEEKSYKKAESLYRQVLQIDEK
ncbi:tetratricopeptide repeat protein, partial [Magnetococcales bacterium HHB-1]